MSDPSNHPTEGEQPTVEAPATPAAPAQAATAPAEPVAPQTPPASGPVPPPPPPAAPPGGGWGYPPPAAPSGGGWGYPPPPGAWPHRGGWRRRSLALTVAVGVVGLLLGCLLGGAITLVATHLHGGAYRGPGRPAPFYQPRRGPGFAPYDRPGFGPNQKVLPASPPASPTS
jgi:hypothetical protein